MTRTEAPSGSTFVALTGSQTGWETHKGTSIGLAMVQKAVQRIGGTVGLESKPGEREAGSGASLQHPEAAKDWPLIYTQPAH